ncbi:helix-turn-helix domain-containing protein, partial [Pararhodospirillum oryzae]|uniref:helix-turn-helix domain-containing protein n=1 Tax=Pararhodospirillum oryzae TaxID=478448 RepID=UPI002482AFA9
METAFADRSKPDRTPSGSHVGTLLRQTRERLGEPLDLVADALRIRQSYLEAIEEGRYVDLPGGAYAIGFVRAYADHLGLHAEEVVRRFKEESLSNRPSSSLEFPVPPNEGGVPAGALVGLGLILAACAYGGWYWLSSTNRPLADFIPDIPEHFAALVNSEPAAGTASAPSADAPPAVFVPDASRPDASRPDASRPDASGPDASGEESSLPGPDAEDASEALPDAPPPSGAPTREAPALPDTAASSGAGPTPSPDTPALDLRAGETRVVDPRVVDLRAEETRVSGPEVPPPSSPSLSPKAPMPAPEASPAASAPAPAA